MREPQKLAPPGNAEGGKERSPLTDPPPLHGIRAFTQGYAGCGIRYTLLCSQCTSSPSKTNARLCRVPPSDTESAGFPGAFIWNSHHISSTLQWLHPHSRADTATRLKTLAEKRVDRLDIQTFNEG
ncbi:hypothetical protein BaRGS_00001932 [Batillaria attramentaria]|uniref:Uncharacterized protein n=1 Tax=Batillaria attramentaria TaxID=370345 RepID=A0ABD0M6M8_9CAEN